MALVNNSWNTSFFGAGAGYGDTWDPTKNPISIGFIPGYALQSRELLELQTILAYQTSTTNRCLFRHGQPRVDLETESLDSVNEKSPVTRFGNGANARLRVYKNAEFFCNFQTPADPPQWIPTGFWLTFPPYLDDTDDKLSIPIPTNMSTGEYLGFNVLIRVVSGDATDTDQFGNLYDFRDPVGREYANSQAPGAGRLVYEIENTGTVDAPLVGVIARDKRQPITPSNGDGELYKGFVPIIQKLGDQNFVFAFDNTTTVPTEIN